MTTSPTPQPPPHYSLVSDKPTWKPIPDAIIHIPGLGWVKPINQEVYHTHDGFIAVPDKSPTIRLISAMHPSDPSSSILEEAEQLIHGDRQRDYGSARESFGRIADFWTTYLGPNLVRHLTPLNVAQMMVLLKVSRSVTSSKRDTFVDQAAYSDLAYTLSEP